MILAYLRILSKDPTRIFKVSPKRILKIKNIQKKAIYYLLEKFILVRIKNVNLQTTTDHIFHLKKKTLNLTPTLFQIIFLKK